GGGGAIGHFAVDLGGRDPAETVNHFSCRKACFDALSIPYVRSSEQLRGRKLLPMSYILALDQGTTSCRAIVFDESGAVRASAQKEFRQYFPQPGWVEHDAQEIWAAQAGVAAEALASARLGADGISAIGITNQRETTLAWDRRTGEPIGRAIVWQDRRTA